MLKTGQTDQCTTKNEALSKFAGGWGTAQFSLTTLLDRARCGLCFFNENMNQFTHMKFTGATFYAVPAPNISWLLHFDNHFTNEEQDYKLIKTWCHPLHLLLKRKTIILQSLERYQRGKWKKYKLKPSPELCYRWYDKETFAKFLLASYRWTTVDFRNPFGPPGADLLDQQQQDIFWKNEWTKQTDPKWLNRLDWDKDFVGDNNAGGTNSWTDGLAKKFIYWLAGKTWTKKGAYSPFCPPIIDGPLNAFYFFYYFHFKLAGRTFDNPLPGDPNHEVNPIPKCTDFNPRKSLCRYCISPKDLDKHGFIKRKRFKRLTRAHKQHRVEHHHRKKVRWLDQQSETTNTETKEYPQEKTSEFRLQF